MVPYDRRHWLGSLLTVRGSVIGAVSPRVLLAALAAAGLAWLHTHGYSIKIPIAVPALTGTVLGLLLAFRTNTGYDRFWEGRKAWGAIVNRTRNLGRQSVTSFDDPHIRKHLATLAVAFAHAARHELRGDKDYPEIFRLFDEETAQSLMKPPGPALRVLSEIGSTLHQGRLDGHLDSIDQARLEEDATKLIDSIGVCQRIQKTPIPFAYAIFVRRFLLLYTLTLGFALAPVLEWWSVGAVAVISYFLYGIEQIGVEIEDPFEQGANDLDLDAICATIERNVMALVADVDESTG
jgi:putative membrane protein